MKLAFILACMPMHAQWVIGNGDSILSAAEYMEMVRNYHPLVRKAQLQVARGEATVLAARGNFDPKLFGAADQKIFQDTRYYRHINGGVQVPTRLGLRVEGFYENNNGIYLNPEEKVPDAGLFGASLYLPVGEGLFFDQARLQWKRANIWNDMSEATRSSMVNQVLFEAYSAYWEWFEHYYGYLLYEEAYATALERKNWILQKARLGERPFIDTLEAQTQVYQRSVKANESLMKLQQAALKLSMFLWLDEENVLVLQLDVRPDSPEDALRMPFNRSLNTADLAAVVDNHPDQLLAGARVDLRAADLRWKKEQLKPEINLKYSKLITDANTDYGLTNDHRVGVEVGMPALMRKERGELKIAQLEMRESELDLQQKRQQLITYLQSALVERERLSEQVRLTSASSKAFSELTSAEQELFDLGESSLFLLNGRELSALNATGEYYQSVAALAIAVGKIYHAAGTMEDMIE